MLVVIGIAVGQRRYFDELGAAQAQRILLLLALSLRNDYQCPVTAGVGDNGKSNPRIAGRSFQHQSAGL